jgi:hypothetical protein
LGFALQIVRKQFPPALIDALRHGGIHAEFDARPLSMDDIIREIAARLVNWAGVDPGERMTRWSGDS